MHIKIAPLKKDISKLLSLKRFLLISINMKNLFYKLSQARFFTKKTYNKKKKNYNNLGIRTVIIHSTIGSNNVS